MLLEPPEKPVLANEREARSSMNPSLQVSQKAKKETLRVFACLRLSDVCLFVCASACVCVGVCASVRVACSRVLGSFG